MTTTIPADENKAFGEKLNKMSTKRISAPWPFETKDSLPPAKKQVGGKHYVDLVIQPVEYAHKNKLGFCEGNVVKYVTRWKDKGGVADLEKAKHYIELLIAMEQETEDSDASVC